MAVPYNRLSRVLVVDDDEATRQSFSTALELCGFDVCVADSGHGGLVLVRRAKPDVILIDVNLPDISGIEVLRQLRQSGFSVPVIMMTGFATTQTAVEAMRLGAHNFVEKPLDIDNLRSLVEDIGRPLSQPFAIVADHDGVTLHASVRLAEIIVRIVDSPSDPKTLSGWGHYVGASSGAIRNWCATMHLRSKRVLDFARVLRAVIRQREGFGPEDLLDVVDRRTLEHLLTLGGPIHSNVRELPGSIDEFLTMQRFVTNAGVIDEVRKRVKGRAVT